MRSRTPTPSDREIAAGDLVVWDMGARIDGYCSDCTRTFAVGEIGEPAREAYELVRVAQRAGLDAVRAGVGGEQADEAARAVIRDGGHGRATSATASATGSGSRSTRRRGSGSSPRTCSRPATWSRSSPASTCRASSGSGSRTWSSVTEDGYRNLSSLPKELRVVE